MREMRYDKSSIRDRFGFGHQTNFFFSNGGRSTFTLLRFSSFTNITSQQKMGVLFFQGYGWT